MMTALAVGMQVTASGGRQQGQACYMGCMKPPHDDVVVIGLSPTRRSQPIRGLRIVSPRAQPTLAATSDLGTTRLALSTPMSGDASARSGTCVARPALAEQALDSMWILPRLSSTSSFDTVGRKFTPEARVGRPGRITLNRPPLGSLSNPEERASGPRDGIPPRMDTRRNSATFGSAGGIAPVWLSK